MAILVTGGAGYIGSHMTYGLRDRGEQVVVLDNLTTGIRSLVSPEAAFVKGTVGEPGVAEAVLEKHDIEAVIHFAGSIVVPESVADPAKYYRNNTAASSALIEACVRKGVKNFIFSSTAAVYGVPQVPLVTEDAAPAPINPYGRSKLMTEWVLADVARAHDFRFVALRYFNVAGADPKGRTGQSTPNATHLIKRACQVALGREPCLDIFGQDYPTPDGTGGPGLYSCERSDLGPSAGAGSFAPRRRIFDFQCRLWQGLQRPGGGRGHRERHGAESARPAEPEAAWRSRHAGGRPLPAEAAPQMAAAA